MKFLFLIFIFLLHLSSLNANNCEVISRCLVKMDDCSLTVVNQGTQMLASIPIHEKQKLHCFYTKTIEVKKNKVYKTFEKKEISRDKKYHLENYESTKQGNFQAANVLRNWCEKKSRDFIHHTPSC